MFSISRLLQKQSHRIARKSTPPKLERLEDRWVPHHRSMVLGAAAGSDPIVRVYNPATNVESLRITAYDTSFRGGASAAGIDIEDDGAPDLIVTGAGAGGGPHVKLFDAHTGATLRSFFAYDASFRGGVNVAIGDVTGDGTPDIVTGTGANGGPHVKVFDGFTGKVVWEFFAYDASFRGGVNVAVGDVTGDGRADIVTGAASNGGPHVKVFDSATHRVATEFFAFDAAFRGGVRIALGDVNGDDREDIVVGAGETGGPHLRVFSGADNKVLRDFFVYEAAFRGGVYVGMLDVDDDELDEIIVRPGTGRQDALRIYSGGFHRASDGTITTAVAANDSSIIDEQAGRDANGLLRGPGI